MRGELILLLHSVLFTQLETVTIAGEGLQILACARRSWPLSRPNLSYGHLRGPVTLTPVAERLAMELSLHVLAT